MAKKLTITVKSTGGRVPMAENGRRYIESDPVVVDNNQYYRRRITDGELVEVAPPYSTPKVGA